MTKVLANEKELSLEVLAEYMDDELREAINSTDFKDDQDYIEKYIEQAKEKDPSFLQILEKEFGAV